MQPLLQNTMQNHQIPSLHIKVSVSPFTISRMLSTILWVPVSKKEIAKLVVALGTYDIEVAG